MSHSFNVSFKRKPMKPIIDLIDNRLFSFEPIENTDWEIITDQQKADIYLYNDDAEEVWLDLQEKNDLDWDFPRNPEEESEWEVLKNEIKERLEEVKFANYYNEVEYDLLNCYLNIKHKQNNPLWNMVFKAYKAGAFPCGWSGVYPKGKLVVFHPKYKPNAMQNLHDLVSDFFENLESSPKNPQGLDKLCTLFDEKAFIYNKGEELTGIDQIKSFYQKFAQETQEIKYLWQKQLTNGKNYFEVRAGYVIKTKNGAIKSQTQTMCFDIQNEKINRIEIVK